MCFAGCVQVLLWGDTEFYFNQLLAIESVIVLFYIVYQIVFTELKQGSLNIKPNVITIICVI